MISVYNITDNIMTPAKLKKLRAERERLRAAGSVKNSAMQGFAQRLGRSLNPGRGKHPTFVNLHFPHLRPLSIPSHSIPLKKNTARSILEQLEEDLECWELEATMDES
jgi:hypothetical protein